MRFTPLFVSFLGLIGCAPSPEKPSDATGASVAASSGLSAGVGGAGGNGASVGSGGDTPYPAIHPAIPLATNHGGPILTAPKVVTITFDDDAMGDSLADFDAHIMATPWWTSTTQEYCNPQDNTACIGAGSAIGSVKLVGPAATSYSDDDVQALIQAHVLDGSFPAPDANTLYGFYFPLGTSITAFGEVSCQGFHAYHEVASIAPSVGAPKVDVPYMIITRCADASSFAYATELGSHELIEAATDPFLNAYYVDDLAWSATHGGELADLCLYSGSATEGAWTVEHGFSNAAALAGVSPCVPGDGDIDFNTAPPDGVSEVKLAPGATTTLDLVGYSSAPIGEWTVEAVNSGLGTPLTLSLDQTVAKNGTQATLTITLQTAPSGPAPFMIRSVQGDREHFWPGVVVPTSH